MTERHRENKREGCDLKGTLTCPRAVSDSGVPAQTGTILLKVKRVREKRQSSPSGLLLSTGTDNAKEEDEGVKGRSEWTKWDKVFSTLDRGGKTIQTRVAQSLKV